MSIQSAVTLKATAPGDFPTLRSLFDQPAIFGWGGRGRLSDAEIRRKYLGSRYPDVECFFVVLAGRAVGLAQLHVANAGDGGGMDLILVPEVRGQGLGRQIIAEMVRLAQSERGWTRFTVDPDVANEAGIRFWRAVRFEPERTVTDEPGRAPCVLMAWPPLPVEVPPTRTAFPRNAELFRKRIADRA